ncbi:MAG: guanylate kinase [Candidatus Nanopelagicales bacterium]|nr:guanylate kinase [Candidatus Nanopelagicales bacterium]
MAQSKRGQLVTVSGPSGVGKSTVVNRALELAPQIWLSVSATTRTPRPGEQDGVSYRFLRTDEFRRMREDSGLLESAEFAGNWYGTPRDAVEDQLNAGTDVLLEIELQGARQVRRAMPESTSVFLIPPSWEHLQQRLRSRGTEDPQALALRLQAAEAELAAADEFDCVIVNQDVEQAAEQLLAWIHNPARSG